MPTHESYDEESLDHNLPDHAVSQWQQENNDPMYWSCLFDEMEEYFWDDDRLACARYRSALLSISLTT